jgi:ankyrin repeat protein
MSIMNFENLKNNIASLDETKKILAQLDSAAKKTVLKEADANGFSLLHFAVSSGAAEVVALLLKEASDNKVLTKALTAQDKAFGRTAFHFALDSDEGASSIPSLVTYIFKGKELLNKVLAVKNKYKQELLNKIVADERLDVLKLMTEAAKTTSLQNELLNFKDSNEKTALLVASAKGKVDLVNHLVTEVSTLAAQAQQDSLLAQDNQKSSALHWAAYSNSPEIAETLMTAAATAGVLKSMLLSQDENGNTPLSHASYAAKSADVEMTILDEVLENPDFLEILNTENNYSQSYFGKIVSDGKKDVLEKIINKATSTPDLVKQIITFKNSDGDDILKLATDAEATVDHENLANVKAVKEYIEQIIFSQAEAARIEAEKVEAARIEAEKVEAARIEAEKVEAARIEAEKVEAARIEAEKVEAARIEAEKVEAARIEAEKKAKELSAPDLKKLAKALFDAHHHKQIDGDKDKLQEVIKTEKNPAVIKDAVDKFQTSIGKVSGLAGKKEKEVCLEEDTDVHSLGGYCIYTLSGATKYKVSNLQKFFAKFTDATGNSKLISDAKDDFAAAKAIAEVKACTDPMTVNSCMNDIVKTQYCTLPYDNTLAHGVLCDANFTVESLIV